MLFETVENNRGLTADGAITAHLLVEPVKGQPEALGRRGIGQPEALDPRPQFIAGNSLAFLRNNPGFYSRSYAHSLYYMGPGAMQAASAIGIEAVVVTPPRSLTTSRWKDHP